MEQKNNGFRPIDLPRPDNKIRKTGYYISEITKADYKVRYGKERIEVEFEVSKGRCKGFKVSTIFFYDYIGKRRLRYLCKAAGIYNCNRLISLDQFVGKMVKLRIVPKRSDYTGTIKYYQIIRFHPVKKN